MSDINRYRQLLAHISENFAGFQPCKFFYYDPLGLLLLCLDVDIKLKCKIELDVAYRDPNPITDL